MLELWVYFLKLRRSRGGDSDKISWIASPLVKAPDHLFRGREFVTSVKPRTCEQQHGKTFSEVFYIGDPDVVCLA
jgi:hypothetical protein